MYSGNFDGVAIGKFESSLVSRGLSHHTVKAYVTDLMVCWDWISCSPSERTFDIAVTNWLNVTRSDVAPKTTCRRLTSLKAFVRWADWNCRSLSLYSAPTPARPQPHPIPEGIQAVADMIYITRDRQKKALLAFCGLAGLRISEALSIPPNHVDDVNRTVLVRGKGDKSRVVPLSSHAWQAIEPALMEARDKGWSLIVDMPDRTARDFITSIGRKVSMSKVSSHDLRATFATACYNKSKDIRAVQELLGHASSTTTEVYIQVKMDDMRSAADLLS